MALLVSLRSRLLLLLFLILFPITVLLLYDYEQQRRDNLERISADAARVLRLALDDHEQLVDGAHQLLIALAQTSAVREAEPGACNALFRRLLRSEPLYINFGLADAAGEIECSAVPVHEPLNLRNDTWFAQAASTRHFAVGGYSLCRITHQRAITFSLPVQDRAGHVRGIVFATADLSWLRHLVAASALPKGATTMAISADGVILARYPALETVAQPALQHQVLVRVLGGAHRFEAVGGDGVNRVYANSPMPSARGDIYLAVGIPRDAAMAEASRVLRQNLLWLAVVALFATVAAWFGAEFLIVRPTRALMQTAHALRRGDYSARAGVAHAPSEMTLLASTIDDVAERLQQRETQRQEIEAQRTALARQNARAAAFGALLDRSSNEIYVFAEHDLRFLHVNAGACRNLGYTLDELLTMTPIAIAPDYESDECGHLLAPLRDDGIDQVTFETRFQRKDGSTYPVEIRLHLGDFDGQRAFTAVASDTTRRKLAARRLADSEDRLRLALDAAGQGLWDWDLSTDAAYYDGNWAQLMGYQDVVPVPNMLAWERHMQPEDVRSFRQMLDEYLQGQRPSFEAEFRIECAGELRWIAASGRITERDRADMPLRMIGTIQDRTARRISEDQLSYLAQYDTLTGLPNRYLFRDRLARAMASAKRNETMLALMFLDLDDFKEINDTLGHDSGDVLLQAVAKRLQECLRDTDTIARPGGDEFTIVLEEINHIDDVTKIAQKVLAAFAQPFRFNDKEMYTTVSVGVTLFPLDVEDMDSLLKNADIAMYQAKHQGGNRCQFFSADMSQRARGRSSLLNRLRLAVDRGDFSLHYQAIVEAQANTIVGLEALLRWQDEELGVMPPSSFLPTAEETGLIVPIGEWVLQRACTDAAAWHQAGFPHLRLAVNVSPRQFRQRNLPEFIDGVLRDTGLGARSLEIELTENALMLGIDNAISALHRLGEMQVRLAIDDFGTGYSSLRYLKQVPVSRLKVDRSFIAEIESSGASIEIVKAVIALAHSLDMGVTAEGVETEGQLRILRAMNCDEYQGHAFSPPLAGEHMTRLLLAQPAITDV